MEKLSQTPLKVWAKQLGALLFFAVFLLLVVPLGAADDVTRNAVALAVCALGIGAALRPVRKPLLRWPLAIALVVWMLLAGMAFLQSVVLTDHPLASPAWLASADSLAWQGGAVSLDPGATRAAIVTLSLPFIMFCSALIIFQGDEAAVVLWKFLAYSGLALTVLSLAQFVFFPDRLLLDAKLHYRDSFTLTFVNRNTAATYLGCVALLLFGLVVRRGKDIDLGADAFRLLAGRLPRGHPLWRILLHLAGLILVMTALFLTKSRAGLVATVLALLIAITLAAVLPPAQATPTPRRRRGGLLVAGIAAVVLLSFVGVFAGLTVERVETRGIEDQRWCVFERTLAAIADHWPLGSGFGAFESTFPAYRDPECLGVLGLVDKAHNVFLEGLLGLGIVFPLVLAAGYGALAWIFAIGLRTRRRYRFAAITGIAATVLVTLHGLLDFSVQVPGFAALFAAILAASTALCLGRGSPAHPDPAQAAPRSPTAAET